MTRIHYAHAHKTYTPGLEMMSLVSNSTFPRHFHELFGIGMIRSGGHRSWSGIGQIQALPGDLITVNPGEIHDGMSIGSHVRQWDMFYFDPTFVANTLADEADSYSEITRPALNDIRFAGIFSAFCNVINTKTPDMMAIEEMNQLLLHYTFRHYGTRYYRPVTHSPAVTLARQRLDDAPEQPVSLQELAHLTNLSRFQLLRGFAKEVGLPPHAYLLQRRVHLARKLLATNKSLSDTALEAGFADQSHMTRAFTRLLGITPGRLRQSLI
ncbi:helix-turn-helix domain-containing protein [Limnobaculum zhutongyuii]|nr:AraC family transcriptional regulator [Limnobaculum zhutongyuii]